MKTQLRMGLLLLLAAGALGCATTHFSALSKRVGPYEQIYDGWGGRLEIDDDYRSWQLRYNALSREERILYCIDQLQNEEDHEQHLDLLPEGLYSNSPENSPRAELIKIGKEAIPYLIAALDRKEKTGITPSRHSLDHWLVQDAALDVIQRIACHDFSSAIYFAAQKNHFMATLSSNEMNVLWTTIKDWWEVNKGGDEVRWAETSLMTFQKEDWWHRWWAVRALYARIGAKSYPILIQAYERLPKGTGNYDRWDNVTSQKENILYTIQKDPSPELRGFLLRTLHDNPFLVRLKAAQCLWTIKDKTGLETILQETKEKI